MSFGDYICPAGDLEQPADLECAFNLWQIQKMWIYKDKGGYVPFATAADAETALATTAAFAGVGDEIMISTPFIENLEIPTSEEVTEAGGTNATVDGQEIIVGVNPIIVNSPMIREVNPAIVRALKKLNGIPSLRAYFVNEFGDVMGDEVTDGGEFRGFKLNSLFIKEPQRMGKNTNDKMPLRFGLNYGWADNLKKVRPTDYDALNDY
ncbi:MAG: hypothetical protein WD512_10495 [Candidatus Paceibacterota bacterium]